ncbi:hypothetical protein E4K10_25975 [Streptomyces sp. T1317-0309]|nr:hypothetical protein E4K10_25975 [Streptomyces sp. T1317-0309]
MATTGAALAAGAATASADSAPVLDGAARPASLGHTDPQAALSALTGTVRHATGPVAGLKPNPLAAYGSRPARQRSRPQVADFAPLSSQALTRPVAQAPSLGGVPLLGQVLGAVH